MHIINLTMLWGILAIRNKCYTLSGENKDVTIWRSNKNVMTCQEETLRNFRCCIKLGNRNRQLQGKGKKCTGKLPSICLSNLRAGANCNLLFPDPPLVRHPAPQVRNALAGTEVNQTKWMGPPERRTLPGLGLLAPKGWGNSRGKIHNCLINDFAIISCLLWRKSQLNVFVLLWFGLHASSGANSSCKSLLRSSQRKPCLWSYSDKNGQTGKHSPLKAAGLVYL